MCGGAPGAGLGRSAPSSCHPQALPSDRPLLRRPWAWDVCMYGSRGRPVCRGWGQSRPLRWSHAQNLPPLHPSHPFLGKGKTEGKYDRCSILQNELIAWQSHREMRLAGEYSTEEAWRAHGAGERPCQAETRSRRHGRGAAASRSAGPTAQSWAAWEPGPQLRSRRVQVHKVTLTSGHPHGYVHMAQDREEHPLSRVHTPVPPAPPHTAGSLCRGWASRLWEPWPCR